MAGWSALILSLLGFAALALAVPRHHQQVWPRARGVGRCWMWRLLAIALLGSSLVLACVAWGDAVIGVTVWIGMATPSAFAVGMVLTLRSR